MKSLKIALSWFIFIVGSLSILLFVGSVVAALLTLVVWVTDATIGYWLIPASMLLALACIVSFFWLNPIKEETLVKNKPKEAYK